MKALFIISVLFITIAGNPLLNQDIIYPKATEVKLGNGETCEVISEKSMKKAKKILEQYWKEQVKDAAWESFNRQYLVYHSIKMGTVIYINGACLEKPEEFYLKTWVLGMADQKCYFTAFVNIETKQVSFKFNTYDKK
ncbi:MAG: hypothetical protein JWO44_439 [Bacteroidetes bacterium]|nr:hypothetical protein [Bacteroidota bacterium]